MKREQKKTTVQLPLPPQSGFRDELEAHLVVRLEPSRDFSWSVGPLVTWMHLCGVDFNWSVPIGPKWRPAVGCALGAAAILSQLAASVYPLVGGRSRDDCVGSLGDVFSKTKYSVHPFLNVIDYLSQVAYLAAVHVSLLVLAGRRRWTRLVRSIESIDLVDKPKNYRKVRAMSFVTLVYVLIMVKTIGH